MSVEWEPLKTESLPSTLAEAHLLQFRIIRRPGCHRQQSPSQGPSLRFLALQSCLSEGSAAHREAEITPLSQGPAWLFQLSWPQIPLGHLPEPRCKQPSVGGGGCGVEERMSPHPSVTHAPEQTVLTPQKQVIKDVPRVACKLLTSLFGR